MKIKFLICAFILIGSSTAMADFYEEVQPLWLFEKLFKKFSVRNYNEALKTPNIYPTDILRDVLLYNEFPESDKAEVQKVLAEIKTQVTPEDFGRAYGHALHTAYVIGRKDIIEKFYDKLEAQSKSDFFCNVAQSAFLDSARDTSHVTTEKKLQSVVGLMTKVNLSEVKCLSPDGRKTIVSAEDLLMANAPNFYQKLIASRNPSVPLIKLPTGPKKEMKPNTCTEQEIKSYLNAARLKADEIAMGESYAFANKNGNCEYKGIITKSGTTYKMMYIGTRGEFNQHFGFANLDEGVQKSILAQKGIPLGVSPFSATAQPNVITLPKNQAPVRKAN